MKRFPNGVHGITFYQQRVLETPPEGVRTETMPEGLDPIKEDEEATNPARFVGGSLTTLLYMAQVAAISQDPWFSRVTAPLEARSSGHRPRPGPGVAFAAVLDVARRVRDELERLHVRRREDLRRASACTSTSRCPAAPPTSRVCCCQVVATNVAEQAPGGRRRSSAWLEEAAQGHGLRGLPAEHPGQDAGHGLQRAREQLRGCVHAAHVGRGGRRRGARAHFTIRTSPARLREVGDLWARVREGPKVDLKKVQGPGNDQGDTAVGATEGSWWTAARSERGRVAQVFSRASYDPPNGREEPVAGGIGGAVRHRQDHAPPVRVPRSGLRRSQGATRPGSTSSGG